jgi:colicin import membrane protein
MARKLKTYQTSQGFFDLAIAAPSMKAALQAWGANSNLFHQGFASEADDPKIVAATLAKPGIVLKRPVGSSAPFREHADLPTSLSTMRGPGPQAPRNIPKPSSDTVDDKTARKAALAYEHAQRQHETARRRKAAAVARQQRQRQRAVGKAEAALEAAERDHETRVAALEKECASLEARAQAEENRWDTLRQRLRAALHKAKD